MDNDTLYPLYDTGLLQDIDITFARFMSRLAGDETNAGLRLACLMLCHANNNKKHICLDLDIEADRALTVFFDDAPEETRQVLKTITTPSLADWKACLNARITGKPGEYKPLILDHHNRLYLYRYWRYEQSVAGSIKHHLALQPSPIDHEILKAGLNRYFPGSATAPNWQKVSAVLALTKNISIISGGPGTGKTHTVTAILALLLEQQPDLNIALCAPTGKAAARLQESIVQSVSRIDCEASIRSLIPATASTIHRLLGVKKNSPTFRHNADNPLPVDVLIVDEASMIALDLMSKLLQAVPSAGKIILLGDRNQLASVEAGAVLGDICDAAVVNNFSPEFIDIYQELTGEKLPAGPLNAGLKDCVTELQFSYRFNTKSGLGSLSRAVNEGAVQTALTLLSESPDDAIARKALPDHEALISGLETLVAKYYNAVFDAKSVEEAYTLFQQFRILCSHRSGPYGVDGINTVIDSLVNSKHPYPPDVSGHSGIYKGKPVMIRHNDYNLKLYNGDIGMVWVDPRGSLKVYFPDEANQFRSITPARLPAFEPAWAMTVHKSQGSEFNHLVLILPEKKSPIFTRELLYTGITRAKQRAELWANTDIIGFAISQCVARKSGLQDAF